MTTNHKRFEELFKDMKGEEVTTGEIKFKLRQAYPDMNEGSMLPNDHAEGNKSPCWCAKNRLNKPIFDKVKRGVYKVR